MILNNNKTVLKNKYYNLSYFLIKLIPLFKG